MRDLEEQGSLVEEGGLDMEVEVDAEPGEALTAAVKKARAQAMKKKRQVEDSIIGNTPSKRRKIHNDTVAGAAAFGYQMCSRVRPFQSGDRNVRGDGAAEEEFALSFKPGDYDLSDPSPVESLQVQMKAYSIDDTFEKLGGE